MTRYVLGPNHEPIPCPDLRTWGLWLEHADQDRIVAQTTLDGDVKVSTVFLGLDHSFDHGPPLLFETMIFGGAEDGYQDRYTTWTEAEAGHQRALAIAKGERERSF